MDDDWFSHGMRSLTERAIAEAARRGTSTVGAEHVLLALSPSADPQLTVQLRLPQAEAQDGATAALLRAGLTYAALDTALRQERLASLTHAGVEAIDAQEIAVAFRPSKARWGASVAAAVDSVRKHPPGAGRARMRPASVLVGVLRAQVGTVPRALALAGIDRKSIVSELEQLEREK